MKPVLVFDIETVPDAAGLRLLLDAADDLSDDEVVEMAQRLRRQEKETDFLPPVQHKIVAISCLYRDNQNGAARLRLDTLEAGADDADYEKSALAKFYDIVEKKSPRLVSWNGGGFDLPVMNHRAMIYGIAAPRFWETGERERDFRFNNYINRYQNRHLDLMDVLGMYSPRNFASLDYFAQLCGFPGKVGIGGAGVYEAHKEGRADDIRRYCECDVLNTYLIFLRFEKMRGHLSAAGEEEEHALLRAHLQASPQNRWGEFLEMWGGGN